MSPLETFFTNEVELPREATSAPVGSIWWELRDGWRFPWRITGDRLGYPRGEPQPYKMPAVCEAIMRALPGPSPVEALVQNPESVLTICNLESHMLRWHPVGTFVSISKYGETIVEVVCQEDIIKWSSGRGGTLWKDRRPRKWRRR